LDQLGVWGLGNDGRKAKKKSRTAQNLRALKRKRKHQEAAEQHDPHTFNSAPKGGDDFDLADLVGSIKKEKSPAAMLEDDTVTKEKSAEQALREENRVNRLLKIDQQEAERKRAELEKSTERLEGENKWEHKKRVRNETRQVMKKEHVEKNLSERQEKKKEFMKNKRKKKKGSNKFLNDRSGQDVDADDDDDDDSFITGEAAVAASKDVVQFGEQAERPPTFRQLPRKAKAKEEPSSHGKKRSKTMTEDDVREEHDAMERMRRQVQAQYAKVRQRRNGQFHL